MSDEITSQTNIEDVAQEPQIGAPAEETTAKGPQPIYEETAEDKALKASEAQAEDETDKGEDSTGSDGEGDADGEKDDEGEESEKGDDESYESLEKPEDSQLSEADIKSILDDAKKEGLSKTQAQARVDQADKVLKNFSSKITNSHQEKVKQWAADTKNDKEVGGDNYNKSVELAKRAAHRFGSKEFLQALNDTGFGNHPEVIRTFSRIGKLIADDEIVMGNEKVVNSEKSLADVFYGNNAET